MSHPVDTAGAPSTAPRQSPADQSRSAGLRPGERKVRRGRVDSRGGRWRKRMEIGLFSGPAILVYVLFVLMPIGFAVYYSLYKWNGLEPLDNFIGLQNYTEALTDPVFLGAIRHNLFFVVAGIAVQLPVALGIALLLNRRIRGRAIFRVLVFVPYVLSEVITGVMWLLILQPDGVLDYFLQSIGLGSFIQLWLADTNVVLWTLLFVITWKYIGFAIILFLAGLQSIPDELSEAASIDGASWWQVQRNITIPLLGPTIRIWVFLSMIGALQLFDVVWIMTGGGPANSSATMATYMINVGFYRARFGYGSAIAIILFAISFVAAILYQRFVLRRDTEGSLTRRVD